MVLWTLALSFALAVGAGFAAWRVNRTQAGQRRPHFSFMDGALMAALFVPYAVFKVLVLQAAAQDFARLYGEPLAAFLEGLTLVALLLAAYFLSWTINRLR